MLNMVHVTYIEQKGLFKEVEIKGHADSTTEEGHDLVCAAVSSITVGALNALEQPDIFDILMEDGHIRLKTNQKISRHDAVVIETMMIQLANIEDSYGKFIRIQTKK